MQPSATERIPRVIRISLASGVAEGGRKRIGIPRHSGLAAVYRNRLQAPLGEIASTDHPAMMQTTVPPAGLSPTDRQ